MIGSPSIAQTVETEKLSRPQLQSGKIMDAAAGMSAPIYFQSDLKINGSRHFDRRQNWCEPKFTNTAVRL